jgi:hypothetical protein
MEVERNTRPEDDEAFERGRILAAYRKVADDPTGWGTLETFRNFGVGEPERVRPARPDEPFSKRVSTAPFCKNEWRRTFGRIPERPQPPPESLLPASSRTTSTRELSELILALEESGDPKWRSEEGANWPDLPAEGRYGHRRIGYDCAFTCATYSLLSALLHLASRGDGVAAEVLDGEAPESREAYDALPVVDRLTCRGPKEPRAGAFDAAGPRARLCGELAEALRGAYLGYAARLASPDRRPSVTLRHAAFLPEHLYRAVERCEGAAPATAEAARKWTAGRTNVFSWEWGTHHALNRKASERLHGSDPEWDHDAAVAAGDSYVGSLLRYVRFLHRCASHGLAGPQEDVEAGEHSDRLVILPYLHTAFCHFYAYNLQKETIVASGGSSWTPAAVLRHSTSDCRIAGIYPRVVPACSTSYDAGFFEPGPDERPPPPEDDRSPNPIGDLIRRAFESTELRIPTEGGRRREGSIAVEPRTWELLGVVGKASDGARFRRLTFALEKGDWEERDGTEAPEGLEPSWKNPHRAGDSVAQVVRMRTVGRLEIERRLAASCEGVGSAFAVELGFPVASYYLGPVAAPTRASVGSGIALYRPTSLVLCEAKPGPWNPGDSGGRYWAECRLPAEYGTSNAARGKGRVSTLAPGDVVERRSIEGGELWFGCDDEPRPRGVEYPDESDEGRSRTPLSNAILDGNLGALDCATGDRSVSEEEDLRSRAYRVMRENGQPHAVFRHDLPRLVLPAVVVYARTGDELSGK